MEVEPSASKTHLSPSSVTFSRTSQSPGAVTIYASPTEPVESKDTEPRPSREDNVAVTPSMGSPE